MFTTQETFSNLNRVGKTINLTVKANGGTVLVEKPVGSDWVTVETIVESGGGELRVDDGQLRITPTGGAAYEITV